jgi:hypothetical protein
MRIGNIHLAAVFSADKPPGDPRTGAGVRHASRAPEADTGDLLALSAGLGVLVAARPDSAERQTLIDTLTVAWNEGTYRPDAGRIADKLLDWGFDPDAGLT